MWVNAYGGVKIVMLLCQAQRMPAVAMTDSNNLFGALEVSMACAGAGVQQAP